MLIQGGKSEPHNPKVGQQEEMLQLERAGEDRDGVQKMQERGAVLYISTHTSLPDSLSTTGPGS